MPAKQGLFNKVEYTGNHPNLRPAASAFARAIKKASDTNGRFSDPKLEAEFQKWRKANGSLQDVQDNVGA